LIAVMLLLIRMIFASFHFNREFPYSSVLIFYFINPVRGAHPIEVL